MANIQPVSLAYIEFVPTSRIDENLAPIIFLHGVTACKKYWADIPQIVANATKRKAYALDARNHGDTEWSDYWNFDVNVDDLLHFLHYHNIKKSILVGHSMGGITSMKLALTKPEMIEKLIVEDMAIPEFDKKSSSQSSSLQGVLAFLSLSRKALTLIPSGTDEDEAKKFIMQYAYENLPPELKKKKKLENAETYRHRLALRQDAKGNFHYKANVEVIGKKLLEPETLMTNPHGIYEGPTLFIYGKMSSFMAGANEPRIRKFFPNAVLKGIEDATHSVHVDKPSEYTDELLRFLCFKPVRLAFNAYEPITGINENLAPIIYLHGLSASKDYWGNIPQTTADATGRKAYAIDARNHGDSEWSDDWNFDINVDDLINFMDTQDIPKAILVGHSMGGITSIKMALKRPDLVEKIIVEDMYVRKMTDEFLMMIHMNISMFRKTVKLIPAEYDEDAAKKFMVDYMIQAYQEMMQSLSSESADEKNNFDQLPISLRRDADGRYAFKANLEVIGKVTSNPANVMTDNQGLYEGPALFIYGKKSVFSVGAEEQHIKQFFPKAVFEGIEDASHLIHLEKPAEFKTALLRFVS